MEVKIKTKAQNGTEWLLSFEVLCRNGTRTKWFCHPRQRLFSGFSLKYMFSIMNSSAAVIGVGFSKYFTLAAKYNDTFSYAMRADVR